MRLVQQESFSHSAIQKGAKGSTPQKSTLCCWQEGHPSRTSLADAARLNDLSVDRIWVTDPSHHIKGICKCSQFPCLMIGEKGCGVFAERVA